MDALADLKDETPALAVKTRIVEVPLQSYTPEDLKWAQNMRDEGAFLQIGGDE